MIYCRSAAAAAAAATMVILVHSNSGNCRNIFVVSPLSPSSYLFLSDETLNALWVFIDPLPFFFLFCTFCFVISVLSAVALICVRRPHNIVRIQSFGYGPMWLECESCLGLLGHYLHALCDFWRQDQMFVTYIQNLHILERTQWMYNRIHTYVYWLLA